MWFAQLSRLKHSFAFRLSVLYAVIFTASSAILFALLYFLLTSFYERSEQAIVEARLKECAAVYTTRGLSALQELVHQSQFNQDEGPFFVRVTGQLGSVLLLAAPADWAGLNNDPATSPDPGRPRSWLRIPKDDRTDFTIASMPLSDGSILQVGRSTNRSVALLEPFVRAFFLVMAPTFLLGLAGGAFFAHRASAPLRSVLKTARNIINTGNLAERVPETLAQSDLADLARQFNRVLAKNERLIKELRDALDNVAHDLRTPLTRLRSSAETALQGSPPAFARDALADCVEESDRVLTMLHTLMDITEAENGMMRLEKTIVPLAQVIEQVADVYRIVAEEKGIALETICTGPCGADADPNRIRQALGNLLDNAIKYTAKGGRVSLLCDQQGSTVRLMVTDTGIGIPEAERPRIWDRLYRGDKSRTERGLGLGLSLVKAVIDSHGGTISVESAEGQGSRFTIVLPAAIEVPEVAAVPLAG